MRLFFILLFITLISACGSQPSTPIAQEASPPTALQSEPTQEQVLEPVTDATPVNESEATDCLGGELSPIGQSIATDYEFTSYDEIITWFCNGAEFEDILVALETESQTDTPAEEMLQMLADGFSWEEIWQLVGLTDEP